MSRFRFNGLLPLWSEWETIYDDEPAEVMPTVARQIIEELAEDYIPARGEKGPRAGIDAMGKEQPVVDLIRNARWRYLHIYFDWLSRVMPDVGDWRARKADWVRAAEGVIPEWILDEGWQRLFGKGRGNPGFFNRIHDEHYPPLGSPPLIDLYMTTFRWWDEHFGTPFRPQFSQSEINDEEIYRDNLEDLNPAARLFLRVTWAVDSRYTEAHCANVHSEYARRQRAAN